MGSTVAGKRAGYGSGGESKAASAAGSSTSTPTGDGEPVKKRSLPKTPGKPLVAGAEKPEKPEKAGSALGSTTSTPIKKRPSSALPGAARIGAASSAAGGASSSAANPTTPRIPVSSVTRPLRSSPSAVALGATISRRPSTASLHMRSPSAATGLPGRHVQHGHSNSASSLPLPAEALEVALAQAHTQLSEMQQALDHKGLVLARVEEELSMLRLSTSASGQQTQIHVLTNSLRNLEQTLQAQREGVEGAMGFAGPTGRGSAASQREKKYEETIQDLQFQLLYGDTSKDLQLSKLAELAIAHNNAQAHARFEMGKLRAELARTKEERIEQWLLADPFTAVM